MLFRSQFYNLVGNLTALENVELASQICSDPLDAGQVLADVGLADRASNFPAQLSGGEQQRVAIARALSYNPDIILADEPTGNLDGDTQREIMEIFRELAEQGKCVILVSHSPEVAEMCDICYELKKTTGRTKKKGRS